MLAALIASVEEKKAQFDRLRPLSPGAISASAAHAHDLELTYTSNAIEGNTLTQLETNLVIEQGITVGGKTLRDHLEAIDHHEALAYVRDLARRGSRLSEHDVRSLHALTMRRVRSRHRRGLRHCESLREHRRWPPQLPAAGRNSRAHGRFLSLASRRAG